MSDGSVATGTGMGKALIELSKSLDMPPMPKRGLPPVIVFVSDGQPTDDFDAGIKALFSKPWDQKDARLVVIIGDNADHGHLEAFIDNPEIDVLQAHNADRLEDHKKWESAEAISGPVQLRQQKDKEQAGKGSSKYNGKRVKPISDFGDDKKSGFW